MSLEFDSQSFALFVTKIRSFMSDRRIMEVFTNPLMQARVPDIGVEALSVQTSQGRFYLHTSPEWEMKKMLAQGSGDIYQIARVFRDDPCANWHQPSFMMLEWYQLGINEQQLINECVALLNFLGCSYPIHRLHYAQLFTKFCQLDILNCELQDLQAYAARYGLVSAGLERAHELSSWLDLIWVSHIESKLVNGVYIIDRYLPEQSALACTVKEPYAHAQRFEIIINGVEVANGYHELVDEAMIKSRMNDLMQRMNLGVDEVVNTQDIRNLPKSSGVSIGLERLHAVL